MDSSLLTTIEEQLRFGTAAEKEYITQTLRKMIGVDLSIIERELTRFSAELKEYENRHGMSSEKFMGSFDSGELGDDREFIRWYACKKTHDELANRKRELGNRLD